MPTATPALLRLLALVPLFACDSRGPSAPPERVPVAALDVSITSTTLPVGARLVISAVPRDANGLALVARTVEWRSDDPRVATVNRLGVVDALAAGRATVRAESEGRVATVAIIVENADACTAPTVALPPVGEAVALPTGSRVCLRLTTMDSAAAQSEFALVAFSPLPLDSALTSFSIAADGVMPVAGPAGRVALAARTASTVLRPPAHRDFHIAVSHPRIAPSAVSRHTRPSLPQATAPLPREGDIVPLKLRAFGGCAPQPEAFARVVAVLEHSIVYADVENPLGGFTDMELRAFAVDFDTLSVPLSDRMFGRILDADRNGRVAIVFTHKAGDAVGFVTSRDWQSTGECPNSNAGEYLYLGVPHPGSVSPFTARSFLAAVIPSVLIHEYTHLVSLSTTGRPKSPWLEEGIAHVAEELLYLARTPTGVGIRQTRALIEADPARREAFAAFRPTVENLAAFLGAPAISSPFASAPTPAARGAAWSLLRFASDRRGGEESARWRALLSVTGFSAQVTAQLGDLLDVSRDWVLSHAFTHWGDPARTAIRFATPGWDMRSVLETVPGSSLEWSPLPATSARFTVGGRGAHYFRFRLASDRMAVLESRLEGETPGSLELHLLRVR